VTHVLFDWRDRSTDAHLQGASITSVIFRPDTSARLYASLLQSLTCARGDQASSYSSANANERTNRGEQMSLTKMPPRLVVATGVPPRDAGQGNVALRKTENRNFK
jgi:hypothetical protein